MTMNVKNLLKSGLLAALFTPLIGCGGGGSGSDEVSSSISNGATNQPPAADAGPDITTEAGRVLRLSGQSSTDNDGDELTYNWVQTSGVELSLASGWEQLLPSNDFNSVAPVFYVPSNLVGETVEFSLTVNDGSEDSASDTVVVSIVECSSSEVFDDCLGQPWNELGGWDRARGELYTDAESNHVQWSEVHEPFVYGTTKSTVIDVNFRDGVVSETSPNPNWGSLHIKKSDFGSEDMSRYIGGEIRFEIKLINLGVERPILAMAINCAAPADSDQPRCRGGQLALTDYGLNPTLVGEWQLIRVPISELLQLVPIDGEFDLKDIGTAFTISTLFNGTSQEGLNFRLAHIDWNDSCQNSETKLFIDCVWPNESSWNYGSWTGQVLAGWTELEGVFTENNTKHVRWEIITGGSSLVDNQGNIIDITFTNDDWGRFEIYSFYDFPTYGIFEEEYLHGIVSFNIKKLNLGVNTPTLKFSVTKGFRCPHIEEDMPGRVFKGVELSLTDYGFDENNVSDWQLLSIPLKDIGLDPNIRPEDDFCVSSPDTDNSSQVEEPYYSLQFFSDYNASPRWQKDLQIQLDNILWEESSSN